jgi:four helix bundle protein
MNIALKEAKETVYRLTLLSKSWYLEWYLKHKEIIQQANEMVWILIRIVKTTKENLKKTS